MCLDFVQSDHPNVSAYCFALERKKKRGQLYPEFSYV